MRMEAWQRTLIGLGIAQSLTMMAFSFVFPFMPLYVQSLGVEDPTVAAQWAAIHAAGTSMTMAIVQPIWGMVADRWGRRPMVIRSMVSASVVVAVMGIVTSPEQLLVVRMIQGSLTGTATAATALVASSTPRHRMGFALGVLQVGMFVGNSVGPLVGGIISDAWGFRIAFYSAAAFLAVGALIVITLVRESHVRPAAGTVSPSMWQESRSVLSIATLPWVIVVIFLIHLGYSVVNPILSLFVAELTVGGNVATLSGVIIGGTGAVSAIAAIGLGRLGDRVGYRRILLVCLIGSAVSYFPQAAVQDVWQLTFLRLVYGFFLGGLLPASNALLAELVPAERRGAAFGLAATGTALAHGLGPLAGAGVATQWGMRSVFLATGVLFSLTFGLLSLRFRGTTQRYPRREA